LNQLDFAEFIGGGYEVYRCKKIDSPNSAKDILVRLILNKKDYFFEVNQILKSFPLIEGVFSPGIYKLNTDDLEYFEIDGLEVLSTVYDFLLYHNCRTEDYKIICRKDSVSLISMPDGKCLEKVEKHPFTFFDLYCPLCNKKVVTYRKESFEYPKCLITKTPCCHFIGTAVHFSFGYEKEALKDFNLNYQIVGEALYFEIQEGRWEKATVDIPCYSVSSYWNYLNEENSDSKDHILYVQIPK
jgi:hypothetical protein